MSRTKFTALGIALLALGATVWAVTSNKTEYRLNGVTYEVPHQYEFTRQVRYFWLEGIQGLPEEPDESMWLLIPASELARDVSGYQQTFHGYVENLQADIVVNVLGGAEARNFQSDRSRLMQLVTEHEREGDVRQADPTLGWDRVITMDGIVGTPAEGHKNFYLMPASDQQQLPTDWSPPSCLASPDRERRERYNCNFEIHRDGLTFRFSLRQENIGVADSIPAYVKSRLDGWRS